MRIEAVTVCVQYSDFLAWTLAWNKHQFDNWIVVTDSKDTATQQVCAYHHVRCIATDAFYDNDMAFNKGAGINAGLAALRGDDWVIHIDADIALPPRAREMFEQRASLDPMSIYGIDRIMCQNFEDWVNFIAEPELQHTNEVYVNSNAFPLGSRVAKTDNDGYIPIGFFQLWNARATDHLQYPMGSGTSARADMRFARQWARQNRHLIPEVVGIHLESEPAPNGANWRGRQTRPFRLAATAGTSGS